MTSSKRLISSDTLRQLAAGSYEHVLYAVERAVQERSQALFGSDVPVAVVATFPGSALVLSEDQDLIRVHFERAPESDKVTITRHELVDAPVFLETRDYVREQVRSAVRAWEAGEQEAAEALLLDVLPHVSPTASISESVVISGILQDLQDPRAWKQLLAKSVDAIESAVGRLDVAKIKASSPGPKFRALYGGGLNEADVRKYEDLVRADISYLASRLESLHSLVGAKYGAVSRSLQELSADEGVRTLVVFAEDLLQDLGRLSQVLVEVGELSDVGLLGQLHDAVAEQLSDYEICGKFVVVTAENL